MCKITMHRTEAIERLERSRFESLTPQQRQDILDSEWFLYEHDLKDAELFPKEWSEDLRDEVLSHQQREPPESARYDPLLAYSMSDMFIGVRNEYLVNRLRELGIAVDFVTGDVEELFPCPCCSYRSLAERSDYNICPVCYWEDNGARKPEQFSGPNHMTLGEGQVNFALYGACEQQTATRLSSDRFEWFEKV